MDESQDLGSGINIPDPQHWVFEKSHQGSVSNNCLPSNYIFTDRYICAFLTHRKESNISTLIKAGGRGSWA
jgi:hypothetical protein